MRSAIGKYFLKKEMLHLERERKRAVYNLDDAYNIGVVYDATNRQVYEMTRNFVNYLKEKQKHVISLGFINSKDPNQLLKPLLEFRYFNKKDLNWHYKPKGVEVQNFLEVDYDILIDLSIDKCFPIRYICGLSKAKFKVGTTGENSAVYYDLMINIEKKKTLENYITQVKHYLGIINKKNA